MSSPPVDIQQGAMCVSCPILCGYHAIGHFLSDCKAKIFILFLIHVNTQVQQPQTIFRCPLEVSNVLKVKCFIQEKSHFHTTELDTSSYLIK